MHQVFDTAAAPRTLRWAYCGRVAYRRASELQQTTKRELRAGRGSDLLVLLEHDPVITLGRSATDRDVLADETTLERLGIEVERSTRGGQVTYHGPGQLVGYPIRRVGRAVRQHVRCMVDALIRYLVGLGIDGHWRDDAPGVWVGDAKIAAVGVDARGGVTTHGFALNIDPDLSPFQLIVPCGMANPATSVADLLGAAPDLAICAREVALELARAFGARPAEIPREEVW